jgi:proline iminopeptidase
MESAEGDDRESTVQTDDGIGLWASRAGEGPPVVLCHGGPGLWDTLEAVSDLLRGSATVHRWDQRGSGRSPRTGPFTIARSVADLDAVRRHFGLERMALLGHSWGALLALLYALEHPDRVRRLVYVSGTGVDPGEPWRPKFERRLLLRLGEHRSRWEELRRRDRTEDEERERCVLQWSAEFVDPSRAIEHAEDMATPWFGVNLDGNAALGSAARRLCDTAVLPERCRALDVPTLIVDGTEDIRPRWSVDSLAAALPSVDRVALAGAGHLPWVESPTEFEAAVTAFLSRPDRRRPAS